MPKQAATLAAISFFPKDWLEPLRDQLSVTTAEQFLDLANRFESQLIKLLGTTPSSFAAVIELVSKAVPDGGALARTKVPPGAFKTGHDMAKSGR